MALQDIEERLAAARLVADAVGKKMMTSDKGWWQEYHATCESVLQVERELAAAKGEEYAVPIGFPVKWDMGAPLPFLFRNDYKAFLTFYLFEPDPNWDGSYVNVVDQGDGTEASLALVEFIGCLSAKLGCPNDEVFEGHFLNGRGMDGYTAQKVENSRWLAELERINSVHRGYRPEAWRNLNHFVFWFHDNTFECIAESYNLELVRGSMVDLAADVCRRLLS